MSNYNPEIHNRQSIRLKRYDYSIGGVYFITICSQNRENLFGDSINNKIVLNNAGNMIGKWVIETKNKFENILIDQYVIMPNHLHCIMSIETVKTVGADLCVCPDKHVCPDNEMGEHISETGECVTETGEHIGSPLRAIIQWFKTMTTNEYIRGVKDGYYPPFNKRIWQRNYYERIIRNEKELNQISEYIINNPINWFNDENNLDITLTETGERMGICPDKNTGEIIKTVKPVGADLCVCPGKHVCPDNETGEHISETGEHVGSPLQEIVKENQLDYFGEDDIERFEDKYGRIE